MMNLVLIDRKKSLTDAGRKVKQWERIKSEKEKLNKKKNLQTTLK